MAAAPPITIGLPIYNAERFLAEAVESIKAQTFGDFTVLAVVDAPTDRSEEILRSLADSRFQIHRNAINLGLNAVGNIILHRTVSPLLARMDADDVATPDRIGKQFDFMQHHADVDVLGTYFDVIDECGNRTAEAIPFPIMHDAIREAYRVSGVIHQPTVIYRRERIADAGGYEDRYGEDYALWLKCLALGYRFAILPEVMLHYRMYRQQTYRRKLEPTLHAIDRAYAKYGPRIWGDEAPDYVSGLTRRHRLWRRLRRVFKGPPAT